MKRILLTLLCCAPLLAPLCVHAAPMTNDDVIKMVKGGLGEATVIQAIKSGEAGFDTSADGLIRLKQGGVNDKIIQEIIGRGGSAAPAPATQAKAAPSCPSCGTVTGIREIDKPRKTGAGTATGAVIGGVLGYAIGGHGNRGVGTAVGAAGGAVAGNVYENRASENKTYEIGVLFDDGSSRSFQQDSHPAWKQGSRVKLVNGGLNSL
jgi:outer membrane lipoprotein SlyB